MKLLDIATVAGLYLGAFALGLMPVWLGALIGVLMGAS